MLPSDARRLPIIREILPKLIKTDVHQWSLSAVDEMSVGLPESMQIAVFAGGHNDIPFRKSKGSDGLFAGFQRFPLTAFLRLQHNPLDIMRIQHGVLNGTNRDGHGLTLLLNDRHVLLSRRVSRVWFDRLHLFTAAMAASTGIMDVSDDVATVFASVECHIKHHPDYIIGERTVLGKTNPARP